jgi:hypothetical protein
MKVFPAASAAVTAALAVFGLFRHLALAKGVFGRSGRGQGRPQDGLQVLFDANGDLMLGEAVTHVIGEGEEPVTFCGQGIRGHGASVWGAARGLLLPEPGTITEKSLSEESHGKDGWKVSAPRLVRAIPAGNRPLIQDG